MKKAIIFDWSGVIKDAVESHLWVVNKMFEKFGVNKISMVELKKNWEQPYMFFYNKYIPSLTLDQEKEEYNKAILSNDCPGSNVFPEIVELVKKMKSKGYFLSVISSDLPNTLLKELKEYGLENVFNEVILDVYDKSKAVLDLIKKEKLDLQNTFFVGDSNYEIEASKENGIKSIAVSWGFSTEQKLKTSNPDFLVHNVKELELIFFK